MYSFAKHGISRTNYLYAGSLVVAAALALGGATAIPAAIAQDGASISGAASGDDLMQTATDFGMRSSVLDISLSPSGTKIAWIAPGPNHTEVLNIFDLNGDGSIQTIASNSEITLDMSRCEWATDERLLCEMYGYGARG